MSFIDITGMNLAQDRLNVISNNIANSNTVGFKASSFNQTLAALSFESSGTQIAGAVQGFSQGTISASGNPFNLAINGNGLFQLDNNGIKTYTRDGQFTLNNKGAVVDATGGVLTGYKAINGVVQTNTVAAPLIFASQFSAPIATTIATLGVTLNSLNPTINRTAITGRPAVAVTPFSPTDASTYTSATTSNVYDSLGSPHTIETFYTKTAVDATTGQATWDVNAIVDGGTTATAIGTLTFDAGGKLISSAAAAAATTAVTPTTTAANAAAAVAVPSGVFSNALTVNAAGGQSLSLDLSKTVQYATSFGATNSQNGFSSGQMTSYSIGSDGTICALYSTGNTEVVGQVALATFKNLNGLAAAPNNQWTATSVSGTASVGGAGSTALGLGLLSSSSVEDSNVNLVNEMVNMIAAQRAFQAQSSVIKTEDQNLQTVVGLKQ